MEHTTIADKFRYLISYISIIIFTIISNLYLINVSRHMENYNMKIPLYALIPGLFSIFIFGIFTSYYISSNF